MTAFEFFATKAMYDFISVIITAVIFVIIYLITRR